MASTPHGRPACNPERHLARRRVVTSLAAVLTVSSATAGCLGDDREVAILEVQSRLRLGQLEVEVIVTNPHEQSYQVDLHVEASANGQEFERDVTETIPSQENTRITVRFDVEDFEEIEDVSHDVTLLAAEPAGR